MRCISNDMIKCRLKEEESVFDEGQSKQRYLMSDRVTSYVVCPKSSCSGLAEEWDVNWWRTPPALFTLQDPVDVQ